MIMERKVGEIFVEIKQNKEDMKENRKLKLFDLEAAKAGKPVCTRDGRKASINPNLDLMMLPERKEGWINIYKERCYNTKEEAIKNKYNGATYVDTFKVEWEE